MEKRRVWDPLVRMFHWSLVAGFAANAVFTNPDGRLHERIGYAILGLLMVRVFWGFVGTEHARFADFPPSAGAAVGQVKDMVSGRRRLHAGHSPLGALMIYNLLLSLLAIILSGWMLTTDRWFGMEWVQSLHEALVTWAEISVLAHIAAVVFETRRLRVNLPKSMVTGYKILPGPSQSGSPEEK